MKEKAKNFWNNMNPHVKTAIGTYLVFATGMFFGRYLTRLSSKSGVVMIISGDTAHTHNV